MPNHLYGANWTEDRIDLLTRLWTSGLSCSEVAKEMGYITRNAVIGKVHRLGLTREGSTRIAKPRIPGIPRQPKIRIPKVKAPDLSFVLSLPDVFPLHIPFDLLDRKTCHWPYGDGPFTFCGCEVLDGPYCYPHKLQSIGKGTASERSAARVLERAA
jgi:GcrA cell cycle regulator